MHHVREHRSVLAEAEKRLLVRLANHLPGAITSDHLTTLAFVAMVGAGSAFAAIRAAWWCAWLVVLALAVNWFGDSLDGTVARVRHHERPRYGYYVDHAIDLAGTAVLLLGMAVSGIMTPAIAIALLAAYCLVSAESYLATHSLGVFRISFAGVGPTELRLVLAFGAVYVSLHPVVDLFGRRLLLLDVGGAVAAVGLMAVFVISAIRNGQALYRAEPLPRRVVQERAA